MKTFTLVLTFIAQFTLTATAHAESMAGSENAEFALSTAAPDNPALWPVGQEKTRSLNVDNYFIPLTELRPGLTKECLVKLKNLGDGSIDLQINVARRSAEPISSRFFLLTADLPLTKGYSRSLKREDGGSIVFTYDGRILTIDTSPDKAALRIHLEAETDPYLSTVSKVNILAHEKGAAFLRLNCSTPIM